MPFTLLQLCGGTMWLVYGLILSLSAVIITNIFNVVLVCIILYAKMKYGKSNAPKDTKKTDTDDKVTLHNYYNEVTIGITLVGVTCRRKG